MTPITDRVKTFAQRCDEHPEHEGIVTHAMVLARVTEEAEELRETARELESIAEAFFHGLDEYAKGADPEIREAIARYQAMKDAAK